MFFHGVAVYKRMLGWTTTAFFQILVVVVVHVDGPRLSLNRGHRRACFSPPDDMSMDSHSGMILTGEIEELGEEPTLVPLCPPQIPHGVTLARTRASALRGRRLSAWAVVRSL
jgi:hypothetical protein